MPSATNAIAVIEDWYAHLDLYQDRLPSKGSIGAALIVLGRLRDAFDLEISNHVAAGKAQVAGLSKATVDRVLKEFGETRPLSAVGGRSNRGARGDVESLLEHLRSLGLHGLSFDERSDLLKAMQAHIVSVFVPRYFAVKRVKATFDRSEITFSLIERILEDAKKNGKRGPVAQHLVGAKLVLRYPTIPITNECAAAGDEQTNRPGDFQIGNTVFHVTVSPMAGLFEKCLSNLERGYRVYVLVPDDRLTGTRQNVKDVDNRRIAVESIESFVATNLDELADFDGAKLVSGFRRLIETYNQRVDAVEIDKSLLIEMPKNLE